MEALILKDRNMLLTPLFLRLFVPFGAGYFLSVFLGSANATMAPILIAEFSLSPSDLGFMSSVYLIFFGLAQFPLGVFLDRYGARATLAPMLLFAVAGAAVFAVAEGFAALILSRALIGIGLSGSLMAAFKAYASWLPAEKLPLVYSVQSLMGGLGGMFATRPIAVAFDLFGWRRVFIMLALISLLGAALIWFVVPKDNPDHEETRLSFIKLLMKMLGFFADRRFWLVAPTVTAAQSVMFAYLYLWVGPWMLDVAGMDFSEAGMYMMLAFGGAALGYFGNGVLASWFKRRGWLTWEQLYLLAGALLTLVLSAITLINGRGAAPLWGAVMFLSTMTMISFPIMRTMYEGEEVGRALSLLNFTIFLFSFIVQWFIGVVLDFYPVSGGRFAPEGYRMSLAVIVLFNLFACIWYYYGMKEEDGRS